MNRNLLLIITLVSSLTFFLLSSTVSGSWLSGADGSDTQAKSIENIQPAIAEMGPLMVRSDFLTNAIIAWGVNQRGNVDLVNLSDVSQAGFLPLWPLDNETGEPIQILKETDPVSNQIAYYPVQGAGWDFSYITPAGLLNDDLVVQADNSSSTQKDLWTLGLSIPEGLETTSVMSAEDWDSLVWSLDTSCYAIVDFYISENGRLPENLGELLNGKFFVNRDFLTRASELIGSGDSSECEIGIIHGENIMYTDFIRLDNSTAMHTARRFNITADGYDVLDSDRVEILPNGYTGTSERTVLVSTEMLADQEAWTGIDVRPLSDFYDGP